MEVRGKHVVSVQTLCHYRYTGEKVLDTKLEKLLEATWQPAPAGAYPDLPQSPRAQASTSGKAPTSAAPPQKQGACLLTLALSVFTMSCQKGVSFLSVCTACLASACYDEAM